MPFYKLYKPYLFFILFSLFLISGCKFRQKVNLIVHNATIYTVNEKFDTAQAMAIRDGKILAIGSNDEILKEFEGDEMKNAEGKIIFPGFIDAHAHFVGYGFGLQQVNLNGTKSWQECIDRISIFVKERNIKNGDWILGGGWDQNDWAIQQFPTKELSGLNEVEYCVEPKFDGASISLIYENNMLVRGTTRGDGVVGDDITPNTMQIKSIPLSANFMEYGINQIEVRGEVMLNKKNFKAYNDKQIEEGNPPLANPRNAAAGSLRIKDTAEVGRRKLEAFLYHVSYVTPLPPQGGILDSTNSSNFSKQLSTHSNMLEMLWSLGFKSPKKEMKVVAE